MRAVLCLIQTSGYQKVSRYSDNTTSGIDIVRFLLAHWFDFSRAAANTEKYLSITATLGSIRCRILVGASVSDWCLVSFPDLSPLIVAL